MTNKVRTNTLDNIYARFLWLKESVANPSSVPLKLLPKISNQKLFVSMSLKNGGIPSISVNTIKDNIDALCLDAPEGMNGFDYFEFLRKELAKQLKARKGKRKGTAEKLSNRSARIADLKEQLHSTQHHNVLLTAATMELYGILRQLSKQQGFPEIISMQLRNQMDQHQAKFSKLIDAHKQIPELLIIK